MTAAAPMIDALSSTMAKMAPVACPMKWFNPRATPPASVNLPASAVWENAAAVTATRREAANTVTNEPSTVSTRS